jgi:hypothetical protein
MRPNAWAEVQDWLGKPQIQQLALNGGEYASRRFIVVFSDGASAPRTIPLAKVLAPPWPGATTETYAKMLVEALEQVPPGIAGEIVVVPGRP